MGFYRMGEDQRPTPADVKTYEGYKEDTPPKSNVKSMSDLLVQRGEEETTYPCGFCQRRFSGEHALKIHIGKQHPSEKARQEYMRSARAKAEANEERAAATAGRQATQEE
ncbi:MAG: hypothetical protein AMS18_00065 [Gemmatimonas sp. SG8_17]|nr:MAG: hypothetical protein AMS18_00065 [Gemmatimonas sp. SG8_17]